MLTLYSCLPTPSSQYTMDLRPSLSSSTQGDTPEDMMIIKTESRSSSPTPYQATSPASACPLDQTQHSAVMLLDLQCQSSQSSCRSLPSTLQAWWWTQILLYLMHTSIMSSYKALLITLWTHSPSRMTRLLSRLSTTSSTLTRQQRQISPILIMHPSWSTLAHLMVATGQLPLGSSAQALRHVSAFGQSVVSRSSGSSGSSRRSRRSIGNKIGSQGQQITSRIDETSLDGDPRGHTFLDDSKSDSVTIE